MSLALIGALLIALAVLSRLFALPVLKLVTASPTRAVQPSFLPATPWFRVASDRSALKVIVFATYGSLFLGMALVLIDALG